MELSFIKSTWRTQEPIRPPVFEVIRLFTVTKVQKSDDGFKTSTQTTRPCRWCVEVDYRDRGREPFPRATWLLTGEGGGMTETLPLCSDHFKELREEGRSSDTIRLKLSDYSRSTLDNYDSLEKVLGDE